MICPSCGLNNKDNAHFCAKCGTPLVAQSQQVGTTQAAPPVQTPVQQAVPPMAPKPESPFVRGFKDIAHSPSWFVTYFKLIAQNCVPVTNLLPRGYAVNWGADLVRGKQEALPKETFNHQCFGVGLLIWIFSFMSFLINFGLFWISLIPFAGFIAWIFANTFITGWMYVAALRATLQHKASAAFDFSTIFRSFAKKPWSLFGAVFLPGIIMAGIALFLILIFFCIIILPSVVTGAISLNSLLSGSSHYYGTYNSGLYGMLSPVTSMSALGSALIFGSSLSFILIGVIVFIVVIAIFISTFTELWTIRSVSHWVKDNAPEWAVVEPENAKRPNSWF